MCRVGILFLFCYLALVAPISGSVINLCHPFNDFTIHSVHKNLCEQSPVVLLTGEQRFLQRPPKITMNVFLLVASMPVYTSPVSLSRRALFPSPVLWEAGFCCFLLAQSRTEVFSWENFVARTVLGLSVLRNLCRNVECRRLKHGEGLGLCPSSLGTKLYYMNGNAYHLLVLYPVTRLAHAVLLARPLLSALQPARAVSLFPLLLYWGSCQSV